MGDSGRRRRAVPGRRPPATRIVLRPPATSDDEFTVSQVDGAWHVRGEKPQRWVEQTDFGNDEAVGYLADRLNRLGVEDGCSSSARRSGTTS